MHTIANTNANNATYRYANEHLGPASRLTLIGCLSHRKPWLVAETKFGWVVGG
jgi:hypothetical protein